MKFGYDAKRIFHNRTGLGNYCRDIIRILGTYYPNHQYFLYNPKPGRIERLSIDDKRIIEKRPKRWYWKILNSLWRQSAVLRQAQDEGIALFHGLTGELPRGIKKFPFKSVVTIHDLIFISHPYLYKSVDRRIYINKFHHAVENADQIIAISEYTKQQILKESNVSADKIKVVYQTCHTLFKTPSTKEFEEQVRKKYSLPERFILNVGTIEKRKNLLTLIQAINYSDYQIVVVGRKTNYFNQVESYIKSNNLKNQVHFLDEVILEELSAIYQMADLMVYTSLIEGFGIPLIESLYSAIPIICHHKGVFPEAAGPDSFFTDMNDFKQVREAIDLLWDNSSLKSNMVERGLEYVQRFDDQNIADDIMSIYNELLE